MDRKTFFAVGGFTPSQPCPAFYRFVSQEPRSDQMEARRVNVRGEDLDPTAPNEQIYEGDPDFWADDALDLAMVEGMARSYEQSCEHLGSAHQSALQALGGKWGGRRQEPKPASDRPSAGFVKTYPDGSKALILQPEDLITLGACIWIGREETDSLYGRFFPNGPEGLSEQEFSDRVWSLYRLWVDETDVNMG